jgi:RNA polymerase sigma factor (sigma-70 family)
MPEAEFGFFDLLARARQGDEAAAAAIVEKYGPDVLRVVRRHLAAETRRMLDSADLVQSVWRLFFAHELQAHDFADDRELRRFLLRMSREKVHDANRRYLDSQRVNVRKVHSLEELSSAVKERLQDPGPSPSETAEAKEALEILLATMTPRQVGILVMLLDGYSHQEIAEEIRCTERTVQRAIERIVEYIEGSW